MSPAATQATSGLNSPTSHPPNAGVKSEKPHQKQPSTARLSNGTNKSLNGNMAENADMATNGPQRTPSVKLTGAWSKGSPIPITARSSAPSNATNLSSRSTLNPTHPPPAANDTVSPDGYAHARLLLLFANAIARPCTVKTKSGELFSGIFSTSSCNGSDSHILLKMVKKTSQENGSEDGNAPYVGQGKDYAKSFPTQDIADLIVTNVQFGSSTARSTNGAASNFRTDTDISGNTNRGERTLRKWQGPSDTAVDLSLEGDSSIGGWDQFKDNERKFGLTSNYDETFYTTAINRAHPEYKKREANAIRTAKEIETSSASNTHIAEERGLSIDDSGMDEETKYSGVYKSRDNTPLSAAQGNRYMPPARRPPTSQAAVPGAPVDDAIISATLARAPSEQKVAQPEPSKPAPAVSEDKQLPAPSTTDTSAQLTPASASTQSPSAQDGATPNGVSKPAGQAKAAAPAGATATVEKDVFNAFKNFSANEKLRAQEQHRKAVRHDKAVKLNDLKKFAQNFKLNTPVPSDLIPILSKQKARQDEILKNNKNVGEQSASPSQAPTSTSISPSTEKTAKTSATRPEMETSVSQGNMDKQPNSQRTRASQGSLSQSVRADRMPQNQPMGNTAGRPGQGQMSQRLQMNQLPNRPMPPSMSGLYQDPRTSSTAQSATSSGLTSPTANLRLNVKAMEFRPNPAASNFQPVQPGSDRSSPAKDSSRRPSIRKPTAGNLFEGRRPKLDKASREDRLDKLNPIERTKKEVSSEAKGKGSYAQNLGIPQAYRTPPTWDVSDANKDRTHQQAFEQPVIPINPGQMPHQMMNQLHMPHHQQLPVHMQQGRHQHTYQGNQHQARHIQAQSTHQSGPMHFDDHQMRFSQSQSSVHPSPRVAPPYVYAGQGGQPVPIYANGGVPYAMSPNGHPMAVRQVSSGGPQYMQVQGMGGHMMTNSPSNGPYTNPQMTPQPQAYPVVYPQHAGMAGQFQGQALMPNGYASPRNVHAPMMARQGSQQGVPMAYMQPGMQYVTPGGVQGPMTPMRNNSYVSHMGSVAYGSSPHQQQYQMQHGSHRGTPSGSYAQPVLQHHSMGMPPAMNGASGGIAGPAAATDSHEEAK